MNIKSSLIKVICLSFLLSICAIDLPSFVSHSSYPILLKQGSSGAIVKELQGRLKYLGYFKSEITGYYGGITTSAVRTFQSRFKLAKADGITGPKTWEMLQRATKNYKPSTTTTSTSTNIPRSSPGFSQNDLNLLARAVYSEARGEQYEGQVAIVAVILNRLKDNRFPNTISGIIFEPRAFSAVDDGQFWGLTPNDTAKKAVTDAVNGWDPTNGAVYYFNPATATNRWIWSRPLIKTIGKHRFCR